MHSSMGWETTFYYRTCVFLDSSDGTSTPCKIRFLSKGVIYAISRKYPIKVVSNLLPLSRSVLHRPRERVPAVLVLNHYVRWERSGLREWETRGRKLVVDRNRESVTIRRTKMRWQIVTPPLLQGQRKAQMWLLLWLTLACRHPKTGS
jgi:hypothetical protein